MQKIKKVYKNKDIEVRAFISTGAEYVEYVDASQEQKYTIAEANTSTDEYGNFSETRVGARRKNEPGIFYVREVTHIDVSPKQIMSILTSLIPFLEHDHATRAEMGSNMMKQAVPLVRTEAPIVGTGT